jgi:hypothetical protein
MYVGSCHCGAVTVEIAHLPQAVISCNCSVCRRTAGLWARFPRLAVRIAGHPENTIEYVWGDKTLRNLRCRVCGCNTHWEPLDSTQDYVGINMRNFEPAILSSLPVRKFDGADTWTFID